MAAVGVVSVLCLLGPPRGRSSSLGLVLPKTPTERQTPNPLRLKPTPDAIFQRETASGDMPPLSLKQEKLSRRFATANE